MGLLLLTIVALIILVIVLVGKTRREGYLSTDPIDTGIERPLWGPLYTLPNRKRGRYMTMHETPWCVAPLKEEEVCTRMRDDARRWPGANVGCDCGPEVPYPCDKI